MSKEAHAFSNTSAYTFISDAITAMSLYRYPFVLTNRLILSATYFASFPGERTSCSDTDSQLPLYFAPEYRNSSVSKNAISEQSRKRYTGLSNKHIGSSISVFFSPAIFIRDVTICLPSAKIWYGCSYTYGFSLPSIVTVIITFSHTEKSSPIKRFCTGVKPVNPSIATTLPFKISEYGTASLSTSSISSFVMYFSLKYSSNFSYIVRISSSL